MKSSRNTAKQSALDFSHVHIEQVFFAICYCLTPFRWFMRSMWRDFNFLPYKQTTLTDGQNRLLNACTCGVIIDVVLEAIIIDLVTKYNVLVKIRL